MNSAHEILYSRQTSRATSIFMPLVCLTISWMLMPPLSFLMYLTSGGSWFNRMPKLKSSCSIIFLCVNGLPASKTMRIKLQVRAVLMTCRPRPCSECCESGRHQRDQTATPTYLSVCSSFDNTGQVKHLDPSSPILHGSRDTRQCCNLNCGNGTSGASQSRQERAFSNRGKPH